MTDAPPQHVPRDDDPSTTPLIRWRLEVRSAWQDGPDRRREYTIEYWPISRLRRHERPSARRLTKMVAAMRAGEAIPLIWIGPDGFVADGHARIGAAERLYGSEAVIPVEVQRFVPIAPPP